MKCKLLTPSANKTGEGVVAVGDRIGSVSVRGISGHMIGSRRMDTAV